MAHLLERELGGEKGQNLGKSGRRKDEKGMKREVQKGKEGQNLGKKWQREG